MERMKRPLWKSVQDYVLIAIGMISYAIGWNVFLLPTNVTASGLPGISSIIYWATGCPVQVPYFIVNACLLLAALKILGAKFCIKTVYAVIVVTILTSVFSSTSLGQDHLLQDQPLWAAILGAIFCGCGIGLGFSCGGSTGGTDIVAAIVNKYRDVSLGRVIMICDIFIISSSYLVVHDVEKVLYGYVVLCVQAFCIDQVVNSRRRSVQFFIISKKYEEIGRRINTDADRGVTVVNASGFYSGQDVKMLFVLAKQRQAATIFRLISEIDPHAFVSQSAVIGVYGEGFDKMKYKVKKEHGV
ncbi:MAG TPA: hypothetical protein DDW28_10105 [Prevotella sp.]|nr:YitT family protein [uncultured Prevotella sp.]HBF06403.1 hypothetical protein [Candidatus Segatella violae]